MAEIHVQPKKRTPSSWLWILISLIIIAAIAIYILMRNNTLDTGINKPKQTSFNVYQPEKTFI